MRQSPGQPDVLSLGRTVVYHVSHVHSPHIANLLTIARSLRAVADERSSWQETKNMGFAQDTNEPGAHYVPHDSWRMMNWNLLTMSGFVTYPHHDAGGLGSFMSVRDGAKIWTVYEPLLGPMTRSAWLEYQRSIQSTGYAEFDYEAYTRGYNILLTEGCHL